MYSVYSLNVRPVVNMKFNDVPINNCLYDCGSECSLIDKKTLSFLKKHSKLPLKQVSLNIRASAANKSSMNISHCFELKCEFEGTTVSEYVLVCDEIMDRCIIGIPLIRKLQMGYCPISNSVSRKSDTRYTMRAKNKVTISPYELAHIKVAIKNDFDENCTTNTVVAQIHPDNCPTIVNCNELIETDKLGISTICIFNSGHQSISFPKNHIMGAAEVIDPLNIRALEEVMPNAVISSISTITTKIKQKVQKNNLASEADKEWIRKNIKLDHLNIEDQEIFYAALFEFHYVFSRHKYDIGKVNKELYTHTIELTSESRNFARQWPTSWGQAPHIQEAIDNWLMASIIYPLGKKDAGEMNSCIFAVPKKKDPQDKIENTLSYRVCLDYRFLNSISKCPRFQMPSLPEAFDLISKNRPKYFLSIDVTSAFQSICLKDDEKMRQLTGFTYSGTRYAFQRCPFGLHAIPAQFQRLMNTILQPLMKDNLCLPYLDDVLLMSRSKLDLVDTLKKCLKIFADVGLKISSRKFICCVSSLKYLGFQISESGVTISDDNIASIKFAQPPKTLYEIRAFMGLASFFRQLCNNFSKMSAALVALTRNSTRWKPGTKLPPLALKSFNDIKQFLISRPSIGWPNQDPKYQFHLFADASMHTLDYSEKNKNNKTLKEGSLGFVLCQDTDNGTMVPISFGSRNLRGAERSYSSFLLETAAAEFAIDQCAHYLSPPRHFILYSDCRPLQQVTKKTEIRTLSRLQFLMSKYIFDIQYIKGSAMIADYGSRYGYHTTVNGIQMCQSFLPEKDLARFQKMDPVCKCLFNFVQKKILPDNPILKNVVKRLGPLCIVTEYDILMIRSKVDGKFLYFCPSNMTAEIIASGHCMDHRGIQGTVDRIMQVFYIPSIYREVEDFISSCTTCARIAKGPTHPRAPLKSALKPAEHIFQTIFCDLFGPLPTVRDYSFILVVVEAYSRFTRFIPIKNKKPESVAQALFDQYFSIFSMPSEIITDFGSEFESIMIHKFYELLKIDKKHTSSYRPSSDGAAESKMKLVTHFLKGAMLDLNSDDWPSMLSLLEMSVNCAVSRAHGYTPYFLLFNRHPHTGLLCGESPLRHFYGEDYASILGNRIKKIREIARKNNLEYIDKYKENYDKNVKSFDFKQDSLVWVYTPGHRKLDLLWNGPFIILKKLSTYNYLLQHIHTYRTKVVSVHRIKPYSSNAFLSSSQLASHAAAAEKLAEKNLADNNSNNDDLDEGQSDKETSSRFYDDVVLLSDAAAAAAHRPIFFKNEPNLDGATIKTEPNSPDSIQLADRRADEQALDHFSANTPSHSFDTVSPLSHLHTDLGARAKSPFKRLGSRIFGGKTQPGFVPNPDDITEIFADSPRITRQKAVEKKIEIPPIWPITKK